MCVSDRQSGVSENVAEAYGGGVLIYLKYHDDDMYYKRPPYYEITFTSPYIPFNNYNSLQQVDNVATITLPAFDWLATDYLPTVNCPTGRLLSGKNYAKNIQPILDRYTKKDKIQLGFTTIDFAGRLKIENPNILVLPNIETQVCYSCAVGQFKDTISAKQCTDCPAGRYADALGSTDCTLCEEGTKSTIIKATNKSTCQACPPNTISVPSRIAW